jgi:hypothetical protein
MNCNFTMRDCTSGVSLTLNHYFDLPDWVESRTPFVCGYFARIAACEYAESFFGTSNVDVVMHVVNGVEYAY